MSSRHGARQGADEALFSARIKKCREDSQDQLDGTRLPEAASRPEILQRSHLLRLTATADRCSIFNVMGKPAARLGDLVLQDGPHCHAPIHPPAPVPTAVPHPPLPLTIVKGAPTVMIGNQPAARMLDTTTPCTLPACIPSGPGMILVTSTTVIIGGMPAARVGDMTMHASCVAPIPMPTGKILPPGCVTVMIGG